LRPLFSTVGLHVQRRLQTASAIAGCRPVPAHACLLFSRRSSLPQPFARAPLTFHFAGSGECARRPHRRNARTYAVAQKQLRLLRVGRKSASDQASREARAQTDEVSLGVRGSDCRFRSFWDLRPMWVFGQRSGLRRGVQPNFSVTTG